MKKGLLTAALLGCLLLAPGETEARHLAEQQAARVEEALRQQRAELRSARENEEARLQRQQEDRERQEELRREAAAREQAQREARALQEAEAELQAARAPVEQEATEPVAEAEPEPEAAPAAVAAGEPVTEQAAAGAEQEQQPKKADQTEQQPAPQEAKPAEAPVAQEAKPSEQTAVQAEKTSAPALTAAEAERKRLELEEKRLLEQRQQAADNRLARHPAAKKQLRMKSWVMDSIDGDGTLLFSSSPEYIKQPGLLYADVVRGKARVLYYHVNETRQSCRLLVVLTNNGTRPATVKLSRGAAAPPGKDYLDIGRAVQLAYFARPMEEVLRLEAGESRLLRPEMDKIILKPDDLIYGVYDFATDEMVKVSFVLCPEQENALEYTAKAPLLKRAEPSAGRGTFVGMDRTLRARRPYNPKRDGAVYFWLGDDDEDLFVHGIDATDGSLATNYGNYGINYKLYLPLVQDGRAKARAWLNPCGGVYAGAMAELGKDGSLGRLLETPEGCVFFGEKGAPALAEEADGSCMLTVESDLQELALDNSGEELAFVFSPPGASYLPVRLILTPDLAKKKKKS